MTEFALVLPILLFLLLAIVQFGVVFNNYVTLTDAVRAGARKGAVPAACRLRPPRPRRRCGTPPPTSRPGTCRYGHLDLRAGIRRHGHRRVPLRHQGARPRRQIGPAPQPDDERVE